MGIIPDEFYEDLPVRVQQVFGKLKHKSDGVETNEYSKMYDKSKYRFFLKADFDISDMCCKVMKKAPAHKYGRETGRVPMTAQMAEESRLRAKQWLTKGCNSFDSKHPISNPMSFWTEQDVLRYIKEFNIPICSVYGAVVIDGQIEGQMCFCEDPEATLTTTGCKRTGCMLCGFGCHLEKSPNRFEQLKITHPKMYNLINVCKNNGVTFKEAIDWINEHGNMDIKY